MMWPVNAKAEADEGSGRTPAGMRTAPPRDRHERGREHPGGDREYEGLGPVRLVRADGPRNG